MATRRVVIRTARLMIATALVVMTTAAREACAAVDLTGRWHVDISNFLFGRSSGTWDVVQDGPSLSVTCNGGSVFVSVCPATLVIDPNGSFHAPPRPPCTDPLNCLCPDSTFEGALASDGKTFTATLLSYVFLHFGECFQIPTDFAGSRCGNGVLDAGEECDDGNVTSNDGCDTNCTLPRCGNGFVSAGEQCDDGNSDNTDACKTDCTPNVCGDGFVRAGYEQCDDGNLTDGDGCSSHCDNTLIPGGEPAADCTHEWLTIPAPPTGPSGVPANRLECTDDDPACDFGRDSGDRMCTFHVALCFNVADPQRGCAAADVRVVRLMSPSPHGAGAANRRALEAALVGLGGKMRGVCAIRFGTKVWRGCTADNQCPPFYPDLSPLCRTVARFAPPLSTPHRCSAVTDIRVPLRYQGRARGTTTLRLRAQPSAASGVHRVPDTDSLRLVCRPQP